MWFLLWASFLLKTMDFHPVLMFPSRNTQNHYAAHGEMAGPERACVLFKAMLPTGKTRS